MSVIGFDEAYSAALLVEDGDLKFKVASLPGIALLKLIAWDERGQETNKDITDFYTILDRYQMISRDRIWEDYIPNERYEYAIDLCCSFLLGFDIKDILSESAKEVLIRIQSSKQDHLLSAISRAHLGVDVDQLESMINAFWQGLDI